MAEMANPIVNALNRPFWDAAVTRTLRLPWCVDQSRAFWPPSPDSPFTGGAVEWRDASAAGLVESVVVYRRAFQKAFASLLPYGVALVALDAGPRLLAHVETPDAADAPRAGTRVSIRFKTLLDGGALLPVATAISQREE